jgi:hypothetical protein
MRTTTDQLQREPTSATAPPARYRSLSNFYTADPRRIHSQELDVGLWWREGTSGPLHRAAWVKDTGELYLVRLGPAEDGGGAVEVLAMVEDRERMEHVLEGWRTQCGRPNSLSWLRERAGRLGKRMRAAQIKMAAAVGASGAGLATAMVLAIDLG